MVSDGVEWSRMVLDGLGWSQMVSDGPGAADVSDIGYFDKMLMAE